jgi:O-antigen/teichoic acid export membrane protein
MGCCILGALARRSLLFNSAVYIVGQFATKALAFVLLIVYARFLEPEDFGITGSLSAYGSVLGTFFVLGLHGSLSRHYFELKHDPAELHSYLASIYTFQLAVSGVLAVGLGVFGEPLWLALTSGQIPFSYVQLMIAATYFTMAVQIPQTLYQTEERAAVLVGWQLAQGVLAVAVGVLFVGFLREHALGVVRSQVVAAAVLAVIMFVAYARRASSRNLRWSHVSKALLFGLPLLPHILGTILMQTVDRIMLERYATQAEVGLYSIAMTLGMVLAMVAGAVNQAWAPHFFRTSSEEPPDVARRKAETFASVFIGIFTVLSLIGALLGHELMYILGTKYLPVAPYLVPFLIGNLIGIYYYLPSNQLMLASKTTWFLVATGTATLLSVGLNLWLLPRGGGGMVAAWIFVAGASVQTLITMFAAKLYTPSLLGLRHGLVALLAIGGFVIAWHSPALPVRAAVLLAETAVTYLLLVRGNLREVLPQRP